MVFIRSITAAIVLAIFPPFSLADDKNGDEKKPLKYWVERLTSDDAEIRKAADEALMANYDGLFEPPQFDDPQELAKQARFRGQLKPLLSALTMVLDCKYDESRQTAAHLLAVIGPDATAVEPKLLRFIRSEKTSPSLQMAAITALLHVTPPHRAVGPTLLETYNAAGGGRSDAAKEVDKPLKAGDGIDYEVASAGISGFTLALMLAQSGRTTTEIPSLLELTRPKYRRGIRMTAIVALAELESEAKAAIPVLRALVADDDRSIRPMAGAALLHAEGDLAEMPAVLKLMQLDETESAQFQKSVSEAFKQKADVVKWLREEGHDYMQNLLRQLNYNNPFYQRQAIRLLGEIGPASKPAVPALITAAGSDDQATRDAALGALKKIDPSAVPKDLQGGLMKE